MFGACRAGAGADQYKALDKNMQFMQMVTFIIFFYIGALFTRTVFKSFFSLVVLSILENPL